MAGGNKAVLIVKHVMDPVADSVEVTDIAIPEPAEGEVLVNIYLRPVNPADIFSLKGVYPGFKPESLPAVPGLDGVGRVVKGGEKFSKGQRVVALHWPTYGGQGTWQQYLVAPEDHLLPVPDAVNDVEAAQFLVNPVTAYGMLDTVCEAGLVKKGPDGGWVVITAASSTLGHMLVKLARKQGIHTVAIVRREGHVADLKKLGADAVIVWDGSNGDSELEAAIRSATGGGGADAVLDCVGGDIVLPLSNALRDGGAIYVYGAMGGFTLTGSVVDLIFRRIILQGWWLTNYLLKHDSHTVGTTVLDLIADGTLSSPQGETYTLDRAREAITESVRAARGKKVFLEG